MSAYHEPVMLEECLEGLDIDPQGTYVDLTFGGGGHSKAILDRLDEGKLYAFDQDADAKANAQHIDHRSFTLIEANFRYLKRYLRVQGVSKVDGILGDLGVSSHQIDDAGRGFSTRYDAPLDMRMDRHTVLTAAKVLNTYGEADLHRIFGMYGEIRNAKTLAAAVVSARVNKPIATAADFKEVLERFARKGRESKYYAQAFQAIRIEVNEELKALEEVLVQSVEVLGKGGRLVMMSYHSLEDRMVKNFINKGKVSGDLEKDFYGNVIKPLAVVNRKPITATEEEVQANNRARSAKLRIAEKI